MDVVKSVNGVPIRLTDERWEHIIERHEALATQKDAVLQTISEPISVVEGSSDELWAVRRTGRFWIVVPYREIDETDGFIITAFLSSIDPVRGRRILWPSM